MVGGGRPKCHGESHGVGGGSKKYHVINFLFHPVIKMSNICSLFLIFMHYHISARGSAV